MVVAKFGGTSVRDAAAMSAVAQIIVNNPDICVVVVSALAGVTQALVDSSEVSTKDRREVCEALLRRHYGIIWDLQGLGDVSKSWVLWFNSIATEMRTHAVKPLWGATEVEEWLSFGERLSSVLVGLCFEAHGLDTAWLDARQFIRVGEGGIVRYLPGTLEEGLVQQKVIVTQGYIASTEAGAVRTLGRGASDFSGALIAEGLGVAEYHLYKDVDGIYESDPNSAMGGGQRFAELSYDAMSHLAKNGAQVIHPGAIEVCQRAGITMCVGSTFQPELGATLIRES